MANKIQISYFSDTLCVWAYVAQGRQKLYGNLGYRIIEANVQEILSRPEHQASWC